MSFTDTFLNSLLSRQALTPAVSITDYLPAELPVSGICRDTFYYLEAFGRQEAAYPYYYQSSGFDSYLILYTFSGRGLLEYEGRQYFLTPDTAVFLSCAGKHSVRADSAVPWGFYQLYINGSRTAQYYSLYSGGGSILSPVQAGSMIPDTIRRLSPDTAFPSPEQDILNSGYITGILTSLLLNKPGLCRTNEQIPPYILDIKHSFETDYQKPYTLKQLSQTYNRNQYRIAREFSTYIHVPPIKYLLECRIRAAQRMLLETDASITEISAAVGIDNVTHFINLFKKQTGVTPLNYRKQRPDQTNLY